MIYSRVMRKVNYRSGAPVGKLAVSPQQLRLMSFGPRREIIAALANDPNLSARDLATRLKRPVTGLYRHLELLQDAGLVRQIGQRRGPKRPEALYALTFATFSAEEVSRSPGGGQVFSEAAVRYAGAAGRKLARAVADGSARMYVEDANAGFSVVDLQLDSSGLVAFNRRLAEFIADIRKLRVPEAAGVETISVTLLMAPNA
jgi:predicted ArsR family transcriptional regulator